MLRKVLFAFSIIILSINFLKAQETAAAISGTVVDDKKIPVAGASVLITHEPTSYSTGVQTNSKGIFFVPNLKPGGPYTIKISFVGFQTETMDNVNLILGNNPEMNVSLKVNDKSLSEVVVVGGKKLRAGVNIGRTQLNTLPTIGRSINDFTRLTPQSNNNSFAGT